MNDMTTRGFRPPRPARPKPMPLYLEPRWRTDTSALATVDGAALLAKAHAGRIRALASTPAGRRSLALPPVALVYANPTFRARVEAIQERSLRVAVSDL